MAAVPAWFLAWREALPRLVFFGTANCPGCPLLRHRHRDPSKAFKPAARNELMHSRCGAASRMPHRVRDTSLAMQLLRRLRDRASLIARAGEFVFARLAAAVAAGDGGCAVGRA